MCSIKDRHISERFGVSRYPDGKMVEYGSHVLLLLTFDVVGVQWMDDSAKGGLPKYWEPFTVIFLRT